MKETDKKKQSAGYKHTVNKEILKNTHILIAIMQELYFHSCLSLGSITYTVARQDCLSLSDGKHSQLIPVDPRQRATCQFGGGTKARRGGDGRSLKGRVKAAAYHGHSSTVSSTLSKNSIVSSSISVWLSKLSVSMPPLS